MKRIATLLFILFGAHLTGAQTMLTLQECHEQAQRNYPLIQQRQLIEQAKIYSLENAMTGSLPRVTLGGQATYQSDVTRVPIEMPGLEPLSKDQYRISAEVSQTLYHGGIVSQSVRTEEANAEVEKVKLEVDLYQIRDRINDLYFGILLMQEQTAQTQLVKRDLATGLKKVQASIDNGTAIRSAADALNAELLRIDQRIVELEAATESYRHILGLFLNRKIDSSVTLKRPVFVDVSSSLDRPELRFFEAQKRVVDSNMGMLSASRKPRVELFVQGGYGRPGLNMLENSFDLYYLGGIRFSWQLSGHYTLRRERQILQLNRQTLDVQQETFLFNTGLALSQYEVEIAKLRKLITVDDEIILLRTRVRETAEVQLEEGVVSATDFIREVNAEDQARQSRVLHETQLLLAEAKYRYTSGN